MPRIPKPTSPEGTVWFGGEVERTRVWLRVLGEDLEPSEVTSLMQQTPSKSQRKGDPILSRRTGEPFRFAKQGSWMIDHEASSEESVSEAIAALLGRLPSDESVWQSLTSRFKVDLVCDVFVRGVNQGLVISPDVIQLLARRGIPFGIDVFVEPDPEQAMGLEKLS